MSMWGGGIFACAVLIFACVYRFSSPDVVLSEPILFTTYREYPFTLSDQENASLQALEALQEKYALLSEEGVPESEINMYREDLSLRQREEEEWGVLDRYSWNEDVYELRRESYGELSATKTMYTVTKNNETLFTTEMYWGSEGPIFSWKIINKKPAFLFSVPVIHTSGEASVPEIWYDGAFVSQAFSLLRPQYIFSYNDRIGFIAEMPNGKEGVYYDGAFLAPEFDDIWNVNCCAAHELLPTVYNNGILLLYAERAEEKYLVEISLITL